MQDIISVIIPVFNEENRIKNTINAVKEIKEVSHICVIDDGSTDSTAQIVESLEGVELVKQIINMGKGQALKVGVEKCIKNSDIIVFLDGDIGETAKEAIKLIIPLLNRQADITIAKFPPAKSKGGFGLVKGLAYYGVLFIAGKKLKTSLSGQRAFLKEVLENITEINYGYGIEVGMTIDILRKGYRILEVEVNMMHNESDRSIQGFLHRGKQFIDILKVLINKSIRYSQKNN